MPDSLGQSILDHWTTSVSNECIRQLSVNKAISTIESLKKKCIMTKSESCMTRCSNFLRIVRNDKRVDSIDAPVYKFFNS